MSDDRPLQPRQVHAPTILEEQFNRSYADQGRDPDGRDEQGPYWEVASISRRTSVTECPDCGQEVAGAHDIDVARAGFNFLVCWDLAGPYGMAGFSTVACHDGCLVACGRS